MLLYREQVVFSPGLTIVFESFINELIFAKTMSQDHTYICECVDKGLDLIRVEQSTAAYIS